MRSAALRLVIASVIVAMAASGCAKKKPTTVDAVTNAQGVGGFGPGSGAGTAPGGYGAGGTGVGQAGGAYADGSGQGAYGTGTGVGQAGDPYANAQNLGAYQDPNSSLYSDATAGGVGGQGGTYAQGGAGSYNFAGDDGSPGYFNQRVGDRVLFDTDSSNLDPEAQETLRRQAAWLQIHPQHGVTIEGHADERGTREYNLALGARRANAALSYLSSLGIPPNRMRTVSYGKERPVQPGSTPGAWRVNRRAVTTLSGGAGFGS